MILQCLHGANRTPVVIIDEWDLGTIKETRRHFDLVNMAKNAVQFSWTDGESKMAESIDWESVQKRYSDILEHFRAEVERAKSSREDFPHKGEEI